MTEALHLLEAIGGIAVGIVIVVAILATIFAIWVSNTWGKGV